VSGVVNKYNDLHREAIRRNNPQTLAKMFVLAVCVFASGYLIASSTLSLDKQTEPSTGLESPILEDNYND